MVKKKIILIEDEAELVQLMKMRLMANNYEVFVAYDGEDGLKKIQQDKPDLVLLDIIMPKVDGLTLCKTLKANSSTKGIPIIIVSASGGNNLEKNCKDAGADDVIRKPFEANDLLDKIKKWLG